MKDIAAQPQPLDISALDEKLQFLITDAAERYLAANEARGIAESMRDAAKGELLLYVTSDDVAGRSVASPRGWRVTPVAAGKRQTIDETKLRVALLEAGVNLDVIVESVRRATNTSPIAASVRVTPVASTRDIEKEAR